MVSSSADDFHIVHRSQTLLENKGSNQTAARYWTRLRDPQAPASLNKEINRKTTGGHSASSVDSHLRSERVQRGRGRLAASEEMIWSYRNTVVWLVKSLPSSVTLSHHFSSSQVKHVWRGEPAFTILFHLHVTLRLCHNSHFSDWEWLLLCSRAGRQSVTSIRVYTEYRGGRASPVCLCVSMSPMLLPIFRGGGVLLLLHFHCIPASQRKIVTPFNLIFSAVAQLWSCFPPWDYV